MRYLRGEVLGNFCAELGIRTRSRVVVTESRQSLQVWHLDSGVEFNIDFRTSVLTTTPRPVPAGCFAVFHAETAALLARLEDPDLMPWSEEREVLLSELDYRKVPHPRGPHYPVSELWASLLTHLRSRLSARQAPGTAVAEPAQESAASQLN